MKKIIYRVNGRSAVYNPKTDEVEQKETFAIIERPFSEENVMKAKLESYDGECEIVEVDVNAEA